MKKKILMVDDDVELCNEMAQALELEGHSVGVVHSTREARELFLKDRYDIVLLDFKLPELNSVEFLKDIKACVPETKVFFVTGKPFMDKLVNTHDLTSLVSGVINKPFDFDAVIKKIEA